MLDAAIVNSIIAPYDLELTEKGLKVKSAKYEFGTVGLMAIYELMFIHELSRDAALTQISKLLNNGKPEHEVKKPDPLPLRKEKVKLTKKA